MECGFFASFSPGTRYTKCGQVKMAAAAHLMKDFKSMCNVCLEYTRLSHFGLGLLLEVLFPFFFHVLV